MAVECLGKVHPITITPLSGNDPSIASQKPGAYNQSDSIVGCLNCLRVPYTGTTSAGMPSAPYVDELRPPDCPYK